MKKLIHSGEGTEPQLGFTPPEVLEDDSPTLKSAVWSLGIILYYMATFKIPYEDSNKFGMLEKMERGERDELPEGFS